MLLINLFLALAFTIHLTLTSEVTEYYLLCNACIYNDYTFCMADYKCYTDSADCEYPKTLQEECRFKA